MRDTFQFGDEECLVEIRTSDPVIAEYLGTRCLSADEVLTEEGMGGFCCKLMVATTKGTRAGFSSRLVWNAWDAFEEDDPEDFDVTDGVEIVEGNPVAYEGGVLAREAGNERFTRIDVFTSLAMMGDYGDIDWCVEKMLTAMVNGELDAYARQCEQPMYRHEKRTLESFYRGIARSAMEKEFPQDASRSRG